MTLLPTGVVKAEGDIIITGICEFEVLGVQALLEAEGWPTCRLTEKEPKEDDLMIVVLSSVPELGWWRRMVMLENFLKAIACRVIVLVPESLTGVLFRQVRYEVRSGDVSLCVLTKTLLRLLRCWKQGIPVKSDENQLLRLSPNMLNALADVVSGKIVGSKVEYSHRYLALGRLGFRSTTQFRLFFASGKATESGLLQ